MKKSFWNKRIPTLFGLFIITISIGITTILVNQETLLQTKASPTQQPQNVRLTNVTDNSFTVSYITADKISGSLNYGKDKTLGQSALDKKDQQIKKVTDKEIHSITVNNLTSLTKYYFTITSGQDTYLNNNQPFEIVTAQTILTLSTNNDILSGKITLPNGLPPNEGIIYITTDNSAVISQTLKPDGTYEIPLSLIRTDDLSSYFNFNSNSIIKILIYGDNLTSNVFFSKNQGNSIPTITLSKDYDFRTNETLEASISANQISFPSFTSTSSGTQKKTPQILTPKKNQGFNDAQPLFKGTALPNQNVEIIIHSDEQIQTQLKTDNNGNWRFRPSNPLSVGAHTITIISRDASGILKTITQSFVVYASGTQIANAIGSPTPTPTPTRTLTPTPTILPKSTTTPTPTPTPLVVAYLTPALSPTTTPTEILTPTTPISTYSGKLLPPTGNNSIMTIGIVGIITFLAGGLLFLLARKGI